MEIEPLDAGRAGDIADLWVDLAAGQREYGSHLRPEDNRTQIREALVRHAVTDTVLLAREDGEPTGFVMFSVESGPFAQDVRRGVIENLFVVPDARDGGTGSRLIEAAESALAERDADVVALEVMATNDAARGFYRDHGYEPHRVEMEKSLENDTTSRSDE